MINVLIALLLCLFSQVEEAKACSELILRGLQSGTKYRVQVRVKLDGMVYDGYWSVWSDPVFMETQPSGVYSYEYTVETGVTYCIPG